jgi:hypothetical protein
MVMNFTFIFYIYLQLNNTICVLGGYIQLLIYSRWANLEDNQLIIKFAKK